MNEHVSYADGVHAVDSGYGRPQLAAPESHARGCSGSV